MSARMHETLTRVISQAHVQPILRPAGRSVVYIHPVYQPFLTDERPTRVRPEIVVSDRAECRSYLERTDVRKAERRARPGADRPTPRRRQRSVAPKVRSPAAEKALATKAVDAATRIRARNGHANRGRAA